MDRRLGVMCAVFGFTAVALGAMGAHGIKHLLEGAGDAAKRLDWWETAAKYHLAHALAIGLAAAIGRSSSTALVAGILFSIGVVLFSGSLYVMCLTGSTGPAVVTPVGGLFFLAGWVAFGWAVLSKNA